MPARASTVTCPSMSARDARTEGGICRNSASLLTFRFYMCRRVGYSRPCLDSFIPSRTCEFLFKITRAIDSLPHLCSDMEKGYFPPPTFGPTLSRGDPSFSVSNDPLPPNR